MIGLDIPTPGISDGILTLSVLYVDEFGSLILSGEDRHLRQAFGAIRYGARLVLTWDGALNRVPLTYQKTFGAVPVGEPLLFRDSSDWLGVAVNQGSAAARFGIGAAATVTLRKD